MARRFAHVIGVDDAPFLPEHRGNVLIVGAVYSGLRLEGVLSGKVRRDGCNATRVLAELVRCSRYYAQLHAVLLQGVAFAGFNVIDLHGLHETLGIPIITVSRRSPNLEAIRRALLTHVRGGRRKWQLIEVAGPMERFGNVYVQRVGISRRDAETLVQAFTVHGVVPEALRTASSLAALP